MAGGEKTEKATQKKREDERKKGNIFQSRDVSGALGLLTITFALKLVISPAFEFLQSIIINKINSAATIEDLTITSAMSIFVDAILKLMILIVPMGLGIALIGFLLSGIQTRFLFTMSRLKPKFSRIDPVSGIKKVLSVRSLIELLKSLIKVVIIGSVLYSQIKARISEALETPMIDLNEALIWIGNAIYDITMKISLYMAIFAIADYLYQWWQHEKDLRMSKQEIKDEYKLAEGDPQLKARIKDVQRKMAQMRMMHKVPQATVVIKNPTHYAVALKYDPPKDKAPIVIAKGKDHIALKIIAIAEENGVYVTENRPLARGLYESVELNRSIPAEFYRPVADVLAFIYKLKKTKKGRQE